MKNVQVIDGAMNCTYPIYQFTDLEFQAIFPTAGQDVEFIEDVVARIGDDAVGRLLAPVWARELQKPDVDGIHGTLFYQLEKKRPWYPNKREADLTITLYTNTK